VHHAYFMKRKAVIYIVASGSYTRRKRKRKTQTNQKKAKQNRRPKQSNSATAEAQAEMTPAASGTAGTERNVACSDSLRPFVADSLNELRWLQRNVADAENPRVPLLPDAPPYEQDQRVETFASRFLHLLATLEPPRAQLVVNTRLQTVKIASLQASRPHLLAIYA
jgi:hypothetical protein